MISENERDALIAYRFEQAKETIDLSRFLIDSDKLIVAVNRIYYGLYYAVTALALKNHYETSKHRQLIGWFNKEFVSTEQIDKKFGKILRNAYQNRTRGDYDAFIKFDKEVVEDMHTEMIEFIDQVGLMLKR
ncbi:MAG: HEPN domain-containing protein [Bacteroidales bacterium]|jgi:uncharacterized protein (UPF0332 family)|nr:HEPN domain-containing protein [Bacteroidales bacterium]MDD4178211.1 HEPN domain-containing protein [Bacteroidales bacterium]NLO52800.1 HEPN domain-containing protein [Bacteroidales bacterium]